MGIDIYQSVTDRIVAALERGTPRWDKPWRSDGLSDGTDGGADVNHSTGRQYNGSNLLVLWAERTLHDYPLGQWLTFNQARSLGGCVRKGEKGTAIVFWKMNSETVTGETPEQDETRRFSMARGYTVFNVAQCDGIDLPAPPPLPSIDARLYHAREFCAATQANIRYSHGNRAYYSPMRDGIVIPTPRPVHRPELLRDPPARADALDVAQGPL